MLVVAVFFLPCDSDSCWRRFLNMKGFEHREKASSGKLAERGRSFRHQNVVSGGKSLGVLARENPPRQVEVLDRIRLHQVHPARETQKLLVKSMTRRSFRAKMLFCGWGSFGDSVTWRGIPAILLGSLNFLGSLSSLHQLLWEFLEVFLQDSSKPDELVAT
jgi:hypothetical protein